MHRETDYSKEFWKLINDDVRLEDLLDGSGFLFKPWDKEAAWLSWENSRSFVAEPINRSGTILDYGCANGFLLRCFQEWTPHQLVPYGIDTDKSLVEKARKLFPTETDHFITPDERVRKGFPKTFDFVYWAVWDKWMFEEQSQLLLFQKLLQTTASGGRFILGSYDTRERNLAKLNNLELSGASFAGKEQNQKGGEENFIAWIDK